MQWRHTCWSCVQLLSNDLTYCNFCLKQTLERTSNVVVCHTRLKLLSHFYAFSVGLFSLCIFITNLVLNFRDLHQMSVVLSKAGLASDAAFTVKEHISSMPGLKSLPEVQRVLFCQCCIVVNSRSIIQY